MSDSLKSHGLQPARLLCPWSFPGKNTAGGLPFPPPGELPDPGVKEMSLVSLALAGGFLSTGPPGKLAVKKKKKKTLKHGNTSGIQQRAEVEGRVMGEYSRESEENRRERDPCYVVAKACHQMGSRSFGS